MNTPLVQLENFRIVCDFCEYTFPGSPPDWHNMSCPNCDKGPLVNDEELEVYNLMLRAAETLNSFGPAPEGSRTEAIKFKIKIREPE